MLELGAINFFIMIVGIMKIIENPFNNYMKKRHIILTTDPDDEAVIYGDACQDNTII